jgi:UDP-2,4-diacetamido-2,4,6-trideoxy-beta-L-altropyranose hydrolase
VKDRTPRTVVFLADAGEGVGFGHVGRCIALAQAFETRGWTATFDVSDGTAKRQVRRHGFRTSTRAKAATIAIVDSYRRPAALLRLVRDHSQVLVAFDDLHQVRADHVSWLIRPSLGERATRGVLGGPRFMPLRREYWAARPRVRSGPVRRILVTLGAHPSMPHLWTAADAVMTADPDARVDVVVGFSPVRGRAPKDGAVLHRRLASIRPLVSRSDLVVTAAGQTMYECLATGVPTIVVGVADNQTRQLVAAIRAGAALDGGWITDARWPATLERSLARAIGDASLRRRIARSAATLVDGKGALRVVDTLLSSVQ